MNAKARECGSTHELQFELKYCERCGGLWLRPVGGGQIYCAGCGYEMAQLPPASYERTGVEGPRMPQGPRWGVDDSDDKRYGEYGDLDLDAAGGVA
jgi:Zn-finger nucleic acid-binding protein